MKTAMSISKPISEFKKIYINIGFSISQNSDRNVSNYIWQSASGKDWAQWPTLRNTSSDKSTKIEATLIRLYTKGTELYIEQI